MFRSSYRIIDNLTGFFGKSEAHALAPRAQPPRAQSTPSRAALPANEPVLRRTHLRTNPGPARALPRDGDHARAQARPRAPCSPRPRYACDGPLIQCPLGGIEEGALNEYRLTSKCVIPPARRSTSVWALNTAIASHSIPLLGGRRPTQPHPPLSGEASPAAGRL